MADLAAAVMRGDEAEAQRQAARLRGALRDDPAALAAAGAALLDGETDPRARGALAFVLGSLDSAEARAHIVAALGAEPEPEPEVLRWLIHALGAWDERPDFDDRFGFAPGDPWVVEGPGGLRMPVRRRIDDPVALGLLEGALRDAPQPDVRQAAIEALRQSLEHKSVRESFLYALDRETDRHSHALSAEALAGWTLEQAGPEEGADVRTRVLDQAEAGDRDLLRLRVAPALSASVLTTDEIERLSQLASRTSGNLDARYFALNVLGAQLDLQAKDPDWAEYASALRHQLATMLARDPDPKLREQSALQLGRDGHPSSAAALATALQRDGAWHVRIASARALGALLGGPARASARQALRAASEGDPDERVRAAAARILNR